MKSYDCSKYFKILKDTLKKIDLKIYSYLSCFLIATQTRRWEVIRPFYHVFRSVISVGVVKQEKVVCKCDLWLKSLIAYTRTLVWMYFQSLCNRRNKRKRQWGTMITVFVFWIPALWFTGKDPFKRHNRNIQKVLPSNVTS